MSVTLTENAAKRVHTFMVNRDCLGLRLAVKTSGCSGMAYAIEFANAAEADDLRFESQGITLLVDPKSLVFLNGTELDFVREGLNEGFKFNNPNVKNQCGCGESFTT